MKIEMRSMRNRIILAAAATIILVTMALISLEKVIHPSIFYSFSLQENDGVGFTSERWLQDQRAVSIDMKKTIFLLESQGRSFYIVSSQGAKKINFQRVGPFKDIVSANALSVDGTGKTLWCFAEGVTQEKTNKNKYVCLIRAYSTSGKLLAQWRSKTTDIGVIRAINSQSALVDRGGVAAIYTIGHAKPRELQIEASRGYYVDSSGALWTINTGKTPDQSIATIVDLTGVNRSGGSSTKRQYDLKNSAALEQAIIFDVEPGARVYYRQRRKDFPQQTQFGFNIYQVSQKDLTLIASLKRYDDNTLHPVARNLDVGAALWAEENTTYIYAVDRASQSFRQSTHYVIRLAWVPRWKSWFSS